MLLLVAAAIMALPSCAEIPAALEISQEVTIFRHDQSTVTANIFTGQTIILRLSPRPITAYRWSLERKSGHGVFEHDSGSYEPAANAVPGQGLWIRFRFSATGAGCDTFDFRYISGSRNLNQQPVDRFVLELCAIARGAP